MLSRSRLRRPVSPGRVFSVAGIGILVAVLGAPQALASAPGDAVQCGDTVTASIQLDSDLNCTGAALTIAASGVTVDLGGHTVVGTTSGISAQNQTDVTIVNGTVGGGISLIGVKPSAFTNLRVDSLTLKLGTRVVATDSVIQNGNINLQGDLSLVRSSMIGVHTRAMSSGITMTDSTVTDSGFSTNGVGFTLTRNTLTRTVIGEDESGNQVAIDNKFIQSHLDVLLVNSLDIENNQFTGPGSGLAVDDSIFRASTVKGNVFDGARVGIAINTANFGRIDNIAITHNVFFNNSAAGILLEAPKGDGAHGVAISDNVFASNGKASNGFVDRHGVPVDDGVHVDIPAGNQVTIGNNVTLDNADHGIEATPGTVIDGGGNISVGDPNGCVGVVCK
ncbi:NosD domain-containing protein [Kutzneria buriramensis]|uniref:Parallel beta helix pectate lyase-like protein n=2 Tax=Kutzneria buriramensis TaxID=1045776 RepID=A0A3E0GX43_9PSEU|nr:NosD domain-containing protein [Kutzneria buriramensis]REH32511.1 hypothetical protein BCF44_12159 [Kutzneria buriramensis]